MPPCFLQDQAGARRQGAGDAWSFAGGGAQAWVMNRCVWTAVGVCLAGAFAAGAALSATHQSIDTQVILSEDGFGACVPEDQLDSVWLLFASKGKSAGVPHVCMTGDCEDLPDIATWASAQQYPDDIDLEREDVVARYGAFVAQFCSPEEPDAPVGAPPPVGVVAPIFAQSVPQVFGSREIRPNVPVPTGSGIPPQVGFLGFGGSFRSSGNGGGMTPWPPSIPGFPSPFPLPPIAEGPPGPPGKPFPPPFPNPEHPLSPPPNGQPPGTSGPPAVIPLPAGMWLLLSALGLGWAMRRRLGRL